MNKEDIYKDKLKALFGEHESLVPDGGWERLEQSLDASKKVNIIRRYWYIGAAAAVAALLIVSVMFFNLPQQSGTSNSLIVAVDEQKDIVYDVSEVSPESASKTPVQGVIEIHKEYNNKKQTLVTKEKSSLIASKINTYNDSHDELIIPEEFNEMTDNQSQDIYKSSTSNIQLSQEEIDQLIADFENAGNINLFDDYENKERSPVMLAMNTGGGLSGSRTIANNPMRLRSVYNEDATLDTDGKTSSSLNNSQLMSNTTAFNAPNVADNKAELSHSQPISFGITVSKNIYERLSVETGLVYTYLYSKSKNNSSSFSNQETQNFHYLGIPLNFNYYFLNIGELGLFATAGGMIEKDIYGDYRSMGESVSDELGTEAREMITKKISQKNPQFSVNAGFGASYPLYKGMSLYGRFGGTYYFDAKNYEHKTIYSDKKIMLDLNVGVRFDF